MSDFLNVEWLADAIAKRISSPGTQRVMEIEQAARYLGLTPDALRAKVYKGHIQAVKFDNRLRFDRIDLDRLIEESKKTGAAA